MRLTPLVCYTAINSPQSADGEIVMTKQARYQIRIQGGIGERWARWFDGMTIAYEGENSRSPTMTLTGIVTDQAALRGILIKIWDLGLVLVSVVRISAEERSERK